MGMCWQVVQCQRADHPVRGLVRDLFQPGTIDLQELDVLRSQRVDVLAGQSSMPIDRSTQVNSISGLNWATCPLAFHDEVGFGVAGQVSPPKISHYWTESGYRLG